MRKINIFGCNYLMMVLDLVKLAHTTKRCRVQPVADLGGTEIMRLLYRLGWTKDPNGIPIDGHGKQGTGLEEGNAFKIGLNGPKYLCIDITNSVIIADAEMHLIHRYDSITRLILRVPGNGLPGQGDLKLSPRNGHLHRPHRSSWEVQPLEHRSKRFLNLSGIPRLILRFKKCLSFVHILVSLP